MGFINRNKLAIFDKTFYNDEDTIIIGIVNMVFRFKKFDNKVYNNLSRLKLPATAAALPHGGGHHL